MTPAPPAEDVRAARRRAIATLLPSAVETDLLRAMLWGGDAGVEAWRRWSAAVGGALKGSEQMTPLVKGLLPLLHARLKANGVALDPELATYLRAAYFREELRGQTYRGILVALLNVLGEAGVEPIVLKGCALSDTVYPEPGVRHSHGVQLLLDEGSSPGPADLETVLARARFARAAKAEGPVRVFTHSSGLTLELRTRLLTARYYELPVAELAARSAPFPGFHARARILSPEDTLIHVLGEAASSQTRGSLRWVCDSWLLLERKREDLNWALFVAAARTSRLALPLAIVLRFLHDDLGAPVPETVLAALEAAAREASGFAEEVALLGAVKGRHRQMLAAIRATSGVRARWGVLRPVLLPSPAALRASGDDAPVPLVYLLRPIRLLQSRWRAASSGSGPSERRKRAATG
jgi:hypothetical protein